MLQVVVQTKIGQWTLLMCASISCTVTVHLMVATSMCTRKDSDGGLSIFVTTRFPRKDLMVGHRCRKVFGVGVGV